MVVVFRNPHTHSKTMKKKQSPVVKANEVSWVVKSPQVLLNKLPSSMSGKKSPVLKKCNIQFIGNETTTSLSSRHTLSKTTVGNKLSILEKHEPLSISPIISNRSISGKIIEENKSHFDNQSKIPEKLETLFIKSNIKISKSNDENAWKHFKSCDPKVVGIDTEGVHHYPPLLIQIAYRDPKSMKIYIILENPFHGIISDNMKDILKSTSITKVFCDASGDTNSLKTKINSIVDIQQIAHKTFKDPNAKQGLGNLGSIYVYNNKPILKNKKGWQYFAFMKYRPDYNWPNLIHHDKLCNYAAADAWITLEIYDAMMKKMSSIIPTRQSFSSSSSLTHLPSSSMDSFNMKKNQLNNHHHHIQNQNQSENSYHGKEVIEVEDDDDIVILKKKRSLSEDMPKFTQLKEKIQHGNKTGKKKIGNKNRSNSVQKKRKQEPPHFRWS